MFLLFFIIGLLTSIIGAICGIGGGIIIKPLLDSFGILNVSSISFLTGCMVLAMALSSYIENRIHQEFTITKRVSTSLAIGAAIGGIIGKSIFQAIWQNSDNNNLTGLIQAILLLTMTIVPLVYMIFKNKIVTYRLDNIAVCLQIGLVLGTITSFLGIGGGPINLVLLFFLFSMTTKEAAENSLYIILFSQATSLILTIVTGTTPYINGIWVILVVIGGIFGGIIGHKIRVKINVHYLEKVFIMMMAIVICINIYNIFQFSV